MSERQPILTIAGAVKSYSRTNKALRSADLSLYYGEITALLGPSGSGKSTLLRAIAGLERLDTGEIRCGSHIWDSQAEFLAPERRRVGMVFQDYALFPHLDALSNVAFGLDTSNAKQLAMRQLEAAELADKAKAYPHQLSGGEQQRVALARALAPEPSIVLLDEPFSGLDRRLRRELRQRTIDTLRAVGTPALIVTHDADEAMDVADQLILMRRGSVVQTGTPAHVWFNPVDEAAARLLGEIEGLDAQVANGRIETPLGPLEAKTQDNGTVRLLIRPEGISVTEDANGNAVVAERRIHGATAHLSVETPDGRRWQCRIPTPAAPNEGQRVNTSLDPVFVSFAAN